MEKILLLVNHQTRRDLRVWGMAIILLVCVIFLFPQSSHAETLQVPPGAPGWMHFGAAILLYTHIIGGTAGIATGIVASFSRKGAPLHRASGKIFLIAMFLTYLVGAGVAPFLEQGQRPNFVAGILALYLLLTGVSTARHNPVISGASKWLGLCIALGITAMGVTFMIMGANSESGTVDGAPPQAFLLFIIAGSVAVLGEANVLWRGQLVGTARTSRHLWRMCFSFFIATGSLFFGQPQVFPDWFNASPLPFLIGFLPLFVLFFWQARTNLPPLLRRFKTQDT